AFSPDGTRVVTASKDKTARVWDALTGRNITELNGHTDAVTSAAFSPDGKFVVTAGAEKDKTARIWDAATGEVVRIFEGHRDGITCAIFSPDGAHVVTTSKDGTARVWDKA